MVEGLVQIQKVRNKMIVCIYSALDSILPKYSSSLAFKDKRHTKQALKKKMKDERNETFLFRKFSCPGLINTESFVKLVIRMFP